MWLCMQDFAYGFVCGLYVVVHKVFSNLGLV